MPLVNQLSEQEKMLLGIFSTSSRATNMVNDALKAYDITMQQFNVLRILRGRYPEPSTLQYIQERMIDETSNATRLVEKLRQKDLVKRTLCEQNRRKVDITITAKGLEWLEDMETSRQGWVQRLQGISPEEARIVLQVLRKLNACLPDKKQN